MILHVAVPSPLYKGFDYLPPANLIHAPEAGMRVRVPFGRRSVVGVVLEIRDSSDVPAAKLRAAESILDTAPILPADLLKITHWLSNYYHHPIGDTFSTVLPTLLRNGQAATMEAENRWTATENGKADNVLATLKRATRQQAVLQQLLHTQASLSAADLEAQHGSHWRTAIAALIEKGYASKEAISLIPPVNNQVQASSVALNQTQTDIVDALNTKSDQHSVALLEGITGSGKTEIYLQAIQKTLSAGKQALVLVPEIGLTPQLLERFHNRFQARIISLHSGKTDRERLNAWLLARDGHADIIIGTRSAIFTPFAKLGIIIVDEEHDGSLKQQEGLRYHARDLAVYRAKLLDIPIILGSATPSLESINNAHKERYQHFLMTQRAGKALPPRIAVLDAKHKPAGQALTAQMSTSIQQHLDRKGQVLLFLNRRGFSPVLLCHDCGWVSHCQRCDAHMTYHKKKQRLHCHHCGAEQHLIQHCPDCESSDLHPLGVGTERIENVLTELFPNTKILRIDRDSTRRKGELENALKRVHQGDADILVGTQILAKGHHFPNVTLVGILDIDQGLLSSDFRGPEYMAQLIMQVAGRAGREERAGEVLIQTSQPNHPLLHTLIQQGYSHFANAALQERNAAMLPPFAHLALLRAESVKAEQALNFLSEIRDKLRAQNINAVEILGPAPAPMERRAGRYRAHLLIQSGQRKHLHTALIAIRTIIEHLKTTRQVRWSIDVDPMEMY